MKEFNKCLTAKQRLNKKQFLSKIFVIAFVCALTSATRAAGLDTKASPTGTINTPTPTFYWDRVKGATDYIVSIVSSSRTTATYTIQDKTCAQSTCSSLLNIPNAGQLQSYAWTVTARKDPRTVILTSPAYQFTVISQNPQVQTMLISPANNDIVMDPVEFKWQQNRAGDLKSYEITVTDQTGIKQSIVADAGPGKGGSVYARCSQEICSVFSSDGKSKMAFKFQAANGSPNVHSWTVSTISSSGRRSEPSLPKTFIPSSAIALTPANSDLVADPVEFKWQQHLGQVQGYEIVVTDQKGGQQKAAVSAKDGGVRCSQGICSVLSSDLKQRISFKQSTNAQPGQPPAVFSWTVATIEAGNRRSEPSMPLMFMVQ